MRGTVNIDFDDSMSNLEKAVIRGKEAVENLINISVDKSRPKMNMVRPLLIMFSNMGIMN